MLSRGSFNGPGGPHTRWEIPATQGGSLGSHHTVRDKLFIGLTDNSSVLMIPKQELSQSGPIVAELTARSVHTDLIGLRVMMGRDQSPACNQSTDPFCDGGGYNNYDMEVVDRMGADSFTPDSGVMISKTKDEDDAPFQWTIDANPQDINVIDFYRPNGTASYLSLGDYRQLADALFHAGTNSGSEYEYVDKPNGLHFYILDIHRDDTGILRYSVGVRHLREKADGDYGVKLSKGSADTVKHGAVCTFELTNTGTGGGSVPDYLEDYTSDIYRLSAEVDGEGWEVVLPNALAAAASGDSVDVQVAAKASAHCSGKAKITLTAVSESDKSQSATAVCKISK
jgi:hypothetical protein